MAKINGMYIFVEKEDLTYGVDIPEHTVEEGISISDHVKRRAVVLSLSGEIVGDDADSTVSSLEKIHQNGMVVKYSGIASMSNCLITEFSTSQTSKIWGGYAFTATLKEIRTGSTSYKTTAKASDKTKTTKKTGTQQTTSKSKTEYVYHTVKKGDTVWELVAAPNAPYKKYGFSCNDVMILNASAFSRYGDYRTLQIGKKIIVGKR